MKSRKSVFRFENTLMANFLSVTHYSPKDKRLYKGQRDPYDLFCYKKEMFVECPVNTYGLWIEICIDIPTWDLLYNKRNCRLFLTKSRCIVDEVRRI